MTPGHKARAEEARSEEELGLYSGHRAGGKGRQPMVWAGITCHGQGDLGLQRGPRAFPELINALAEPQVTRSLLPVLGAQPH